MLPPVSAATPKDISTQQEATPETLFTSDSLLQAPMFHTVPNEKMFMPPHIVDVPLQKFTPKDFVPLADDGCWPAHGKPEDFYPALPDLDSSTELHLPVSCPAAVWLEVFAPKWHGLKQSCPKFNPCVVCALDGILQLSPNGAYLQYTNQPGKCAKIVLQCNLFFDGPKR